MGREVFTAGKAMPIDDGVRYPVTMPEDGHCDNCKEPYSVMELVNNECFPCRYGRELKSWR